MDLYDDIDTKPRASQIDGWSSGIKMLQTQLAIKKAAQPKDQLKKPLMTPVVNLRAKKNFNDDGQPIGKIEPFNRNTTTTTTTTIVTAPVVLEHVKADDWDFVDEYDPQWPNEYEKLKEKSQHSKEKSRDSGRNARNDERGGGNERSGGKRSRGRNNNSNNNHNNSNNNNNQHIESPPVKFSGFGQRQAEEDTYSPPRAGSNKGGGAAIAPPPSLQEISINNESGDGSSNVTIPYSASSVAAKIMAKYGFRDGQGLGKQEQGMSIALQVEKTSKRGGRIIHEKDVFLPPPPTSFSPPPASGSMAAPTLLPPATPAHGSSSALSALAAIGGPAADEDIIESEPSITEIMKAPSKVVLLRNMVGPGDVDEDLEPEVKDECNTKYGDVISVVIHEQFGTVPEDAVKIYVEFKRIESAIKAVVDLNGRFFGGRQVRAGFYNFDKFKSFQLT